MMIDTKAELNKSSQLSRFKTSKFKNAAAMEKKEEHIKLVIVVVVVVIVVVVVNKLTMKMVDLIGLPKGCFCMHLSNHSVLRDLAIGSYNSCGNYIDARTSTRSTQLLDASFFGV